jgi:hypothetical protein
MADQSSHTWIIAPAGGPAVRFEQLESESPATEASAQALSTDLETLKANGVDPRVKCEPIGFCPSVTIHCDPIHIIGCEILVRCGGAVTRDP